MLQARGHTHIFGTWGYCSKTSGPTGDFEFFVLACFASWAGAADEVERDLRFAGMLAQRQDVDAQPGKLQRVESKETIRMLLSCYSIPVKSKGLSCKLFVSSKTCTQFCVERQLPVKPLAAFIAQHKKLG